MKRERERERSESGIAHLLYRMPDMKVFFTVQPQIALKRELGEKEVRYTSEGTAVLISGRV